MKVVTIMNFIQGHPYLIHNIFMKCVFFVFLPHGELPKHNTPDHVFGTIGKPSINSNVLRWFCNV